MILFGINRNIMECKDEIQNSLPEEVWRINRNIMECKVKKIVQQSLPQLVLIETLWNVKQSGQVNSITCFGINRNIMECKVVSCFLQMLPPHCIKRNIMECKVQRDDYGLCFE